MGKLTSSLKNSRTYWKKLNRMLGLELKITNIHNELMERISKVLEDTARKALVIGFQNAIDIKKMDEQQDRMREEISTTLKAEIKIKITKSR